MTLVWIFYDRFLPAVFVPGHCEPPSPLPDDEWPKEYIHNKKWKSILQWHRRIENPGLCNGLTCRCIHQLATIIIIIIIILFVPVSNYTITYVSVLLIETKSVMMWIVSLLLCNATFKQGKIKQMHANVWICCRGIKWKGVEKVAVLYAHVSTWHQPYN